MSEDNNNKHSKMTLLSFEETMKWVNSPQFEGRIGSVEALECMLKGLKRENMDNDIGKGENGNTIGWEVKNFVNLGGSS
jgi:hypothetical protein